MHRLDWLISASGIHQSRWIVMDWCWRLARSHPVVDNTLLISRLIGTVSSDDDHLDGSEEFIRAGRHLLDGIETLVDGGHVGQRLQQVGPEQPGPGRRLAVIQRLHQRRSPARVQAAHQLQSACRLRIFPPDSIPSQSSSVFSLPTPV